jgi:hypothetical protein
MRHLSLMLLMGAQQEQLVDEFIRFPRLSIAKNRRAFDLLQKCMYVILY